MSDIKQQKTKQVMLRLSEDLHKQLKVTVAEQGTTIQAFLVKLIEENTNKE